MKIPLSQIKPSPRPIRTTWDEDNLAELMVSIREQGLLVPIKLRPSGNSYEVVYGHRRVEAMRRLGWSETSAIIEEVNDTAALVQALIENIQREDMSPLDKAYALKAIQNETGWSVKQISAQGILGVSRIRQLLALTEEPQELIQKVEERDTTGISDEHLRVTREAGLDHSARVQVLEKAEREKLPVRATQTIARAIASEPNAQLRHEMLNENYDSSYWRDRIALATQRNDMLSPVLSQEITQIAGMVGVETEELVSRAVESYKTAQMPNEIVKVSSPFHEKQAATTNTVITLDQWSTMSKRQRASATSMAHNSTKTFNRQDTTSIEWALWSWNPVTGCLHGCDYCYARDIANRFYAGYGFTPALHPDRLSAPKNTTVPSTASGNIGEMNVFTCSMADLFGKWVPEEWINLVLQQVWDNPQWNFLFLTKFPIRMAEFEFPPNAWVGTTVDKQYAVSRAEKAFKKVRANIKFISCEPLLERLTFTRLDLFDWVIIGGASSSTQTAEFRPPRDWIIHLESQAQDAGCKIYEKANLLDRIKQYPGAKDAS